MPTRYRGFVIGLFLVLFAQLVFGAAHLSLTSDEPSHVVAGLTYLKTSNLWVTPRHGHPPLLNALNAAPLLMQPDLPNLEEIPGWGHDFLSYARAALPRLGPIERRAFVTRLPTMLLTVLLAALTCRWATELFGHSAGLLAAALLTFDPNLLAHAQLATTDLGVTLLGFAALYAAWRAARGPHRRAWLLAGGLFLGLTLASKGSGFVYAPAMVAILAWPEIPGWIARRDLKGPVRVVLEGTALTGVALLLLWAIYGFQVGPLSAGGANVPLPAHLGLWRIIFQNAQRTAFLRGEVRVGGWWWYFFYTTAVKTPLPLLVAGAWAILAWIRSGPRRWFATAPLLFFPLLYWITAVISRMNIGHRHLLPTAPLLYLFVAQLAAARLPGEISKRRALRSLQALLLLGYAFDAAAIYPFYLAYFNPLAGGPEQGYRHLVDSNVAWGQSFVALRDYLEREEIPSVRLSYYTYVDPAAYGIAYEPLPPVPGASPDAITPFAPQPAVYAISATPLQGVMVTPRDLYDWFRHREPTAQPGYGLLVYDVQPEDVAVEWVAQCTAPVAPLPPEAIVAGMSTPPERIAAFDCTQAWLYPPGSGYHLLAREQLLLQQPFVAQQLAGLDLAYEQREASTYPAFAFYRSEGAPRPPLTSAHIAPSPWPPEQALTTDPVTAPLDTSGPLAFLGARFDPGPYRPGESVELATYWRVSAIPELRNLSLMGHLLAEDGTLVANADGLGVPLDQWRVGDVLVQRHAIPLPAETPPGRYWLQSGAYWLDTLQRWEIAGAGDRILLGDVRVEP